MAILQRTLLSGYMMDTVCEEDVMGICTNSNGTIHHMSSDCYSMMWNDDGHDHDL